jgi:hypothetical protein
MAVEQDPLEHRGAVPKEVISKQRSEIYVWVEMFFTWKRKQSVLEREHHDPKHDPKK